MLEDDEIGERTCMKPYGECEGDDERVRSSCTRVTGQDDGSDCIDTGCTDSLQNSWPIYIDSEAWVAFRVDDGVYHQAVQALMFFLQEEYAPALCEKLMDREKALLTYVHICPSC